MEFWAKIVLILAAINAAQAEFSIKEILDPNTREKIERTAGGSNLELTCTVEGEFKPAIHSIKWRKSQPFLQTGGAWEVNPQEYPISASGQMEDSFVKKTDRYSIEYNDPPGQHVYKLVITNPKAEDSGRYHCFGKDGIRNHDLFYRVFIQEEAQSASLTGRPDVNKEDVNVTSGEDTGRGPLVFYTNKKGSLSCTSIGGFPIPNLNFFWTDGKSADMTPLFGFSDREFNHENQLVGANPGLQKYHFQVTETNNEFTAKPEYDGGEIVCQAKVSELVKTFQVKKSVEIMGPPHFVANFCDPIVYAQVGDKNVDIVCRYKSKTRAKTVHWEAKTAGVVLEEFDKAEEEGMSTTLTKVTTEEYAYDAKLRIKEVKASSFQSFDLMVENDVGWTEAVKTIELREGKAPAPACQDGDESCGAHRTVSLFTGFIYAVAVATTAMVMLQS